MIICGKKTGNLYERDIPAFESPMEFGIVIPMGDHRFLDAFECYTMNGNVSAVAPVFAVNEDIDNYIPTRYIYDLDGNAIRNVILGPSTSSTSKNMFQIRAGYNDDENIRIDGALRMPMSDGDNVIIAKRPPNWDEQYFSEDYVSIDSNMTVRQPKMVGISGHTNTIVINCENNGQKTDFYICLPLTAQGSISPDYVYCFSFYYRVNGVVSVRPIVDYYTNAGVLISSELYEIQVFDATDTEESDWTFYQIAIPRFNLGNSIPLNAKRLRIKLFITTASSGTMEIAYPILESSYAYATSVTTGYIFVPDTPSKFSPHEQSSGVLSRAFNGSILPFDSSKICYGHVGRRLFDLDFSYSLLDTSFARQLKALEHMNLMGYDIALRCQHGDLPPVMVGDISIEEKSIAFDYRVQDVSVHFKENQ